MPIAPHERDRHGEPFRRIDLLYKQPQPIYHKIDQEAQQDDENKAPYPF